MSKFLIVLGVIIIAASAISIYGYDFGSLTGGDVSGGAFTAPATLDNENFKGSADAPVTITEWSDFECPFCSTFWVNTLPLIKEEYIDTGKVKFVYKHFPLSFHSEAEPAAMASECAGEQGKFWEMHDLMYGNQGLLSDSQYKKWAVELEIDLDQFIECMDSQKYLDKINNDYQEGQQAGIRGTPGFIINSELVSGAQQFSAFKTVIEQKLAE